MLHLFLYCFLFNGLWCCRCFDRCLKQIVFAKFHCRGMKPWDLLGSDCEIWSRGWGSQWRNIHWALGSGRVIPRGSQSVCVAQLGWRKWGLRGWHWILISHHLQGPWIQEKQRGCSEKTLKQTTVGVNSQFYGQSKWVGSQQFLLHIKWKLFWHFSLSKMGTPTFNIQAWILQSPVTRLVSHILTISTSCWLSLWNMFRVCCGFCCPHPILPHTLPHQLIASYLGLFPI